MYRKLITLLVGAVLLIPTPVAHAQKSWRWKECRFQYVDGKAGWSQDEVKLTIRCAAERYHVSVTTALYIADRESHFGQYATNPYSGACGVYQHIPTYWPSRLQSLKNMHPATSPMGSSCFDARSNVMVALHMAHHQGWGAWGM